MRKPKVAKPQSISPFSLSRKLPSAATQKSAPPTIASPPKPRFAKPPSIRKK